MNSAISTEEAGSSAAESSPYENRRVLLAGNPNCGKTTIFNLLTGSRYKVANYPGVTVEKKEGVLRLGKHSSIRVVDLPGIYSLSGQSEDEVVAEKELRLAQESGADLVVVVVDASNLERNLFLVSELLDFGLPVLLALNMSDIAQRDGLEIREALLSRKLDVPVVRLTASKKKGICELGSCIAQVLEKETMVSGASYAWARGNDDLIAAANSRDNDAPAEQAGAVASERYQWIGSIIKDAVVQRNAHASRRSDAVDAWALHPVFGPLIFVVLMALVFQAIFSWASLPMDTIDQGVAWMGSWLENVLPAGELRSLLVDGVVVGVGSVIIFVPQIAILFLLIGLLEESGYLCRAAFIMDRLMRQVGLQGRSFIPLLSSFACAVPGIMATRTIPSRSDRLITIMVAPLMSCSARLPVYTVLIGAFIPPVMLGGVVSLQGVLLFGLYLLGIVAAAAVAWILKMSVLRGKPALFLMEMPRYRLPSFRLVLREVLDRVWIFLRSAGTIILACSVVLWFLASHPRSDSGEVKIADSYAGSIGSIIEPVIAPLGYDMEIGISLLASFAAREVFISALATIYNIEDDEGSAESLVRTLKRRRESGTGFGIATAASLLIFYVFACQCMSTLAVCRRETGSWLWPSVMFVYMTVLAYGAAFVVYRIMLALFGAAA